MLDVGWPEPAEVLHRIESTRSCWASSRTSSMVFMALSWLASDCVRPGSPTLVRGHCLLVQMRTGPPVLVHPRRDCAGFIGGWSLDLSIRHAIFVIARLTFAISVARRQRSVDSPR